MDLHARGVGSTVNPILGTFSQSQNRVILITGLVCGCISLIATLTTLRWFISMRRLFRHHLVLLLILSDTFKALWYFVSPVVVFARGPVDSSSRWCQASGYFLSLGIEASDFAVLLIAVHAGLYVFRPPVRNVEGGLYPLRKWIPLFWLGFPVTAASLAFVNPGHAYVTAGTYCYLPQRPIWYRLALAWIPRYIILITILATYAAISIYVHVKFRGFRHLKGSDPLSGSFNEKGQSSIAPDSPASELASPKITAIKQDSPQTSPSDTPRSCSYSSPADLTSRPIPALEPWDAMNFLTAKPLNQPVSPQTGVATEGFAAQSRKASDREVPTRAAVYSPVGGTGPDGQDGERSAVLLSGSHNEDDDSTRASRATISGHHTSKKTATDPLSKTRAAIRHQLRALFLYPVVYVAMWIFPFANNVRLFKDSTASRPIFWLQILATVSISLQAGIDCIIFSWREKPWRRIDRKSRLSISFWKDRSVSFAKRVTFNGSILGGSRHASSAAAAPPMRTFDEPLAPPRRTRDANWWEAEGRKRKDSVWLGTDLMTHIASRQSERSRPSQEDRSAYV